MGVNENSTTFLYTFDQGGQENIFLEGEKVFLSSFLKCITKWKYQQQQILVFSFSFLVSVYPNNRTQDTHNQNS